MLNISINHTLQLGRCVSWWSREHFRIQVLDIKEIISVRLTCLHPLQQWRQILWEGCGVLTAQTQAAWSRQCAPGTTQARFTFLLRCSYDSCRSSIQLSANPTDVPPAVDGTHCCRPVRREPDAVFLGTDKVPREVMRVATQKVQYPYSTIEIQPRGLWLQGCHDIP